MKKLSISAVAFLFILFSAVTSFAKGYPAEKFTTPDQGTIVKDGDITTAYNKHGRWVYTIEHYSTDNLPQNIVDFVTDNYGGYDIAGMEKVEQPGSDPVFIVHMQDYTSIKTVQVCGDDSIITEDYIKG